MPALFLKDIGMRARPADVMIYLDADVLCVRALDPVIAEAARGQIVVFEDRLALFENERSGSPPVIYKAWQARLSLERLRARPYANAGMMILPNKIGLKLLGELKDAQRHVDDDETFVGKTDIPRPSDPFYYGDQDLLNAFLADARYFDSTTTFPHENALSPPYPELVVGREGVTCAPASPGVGPPFLLHQILSKPWLKRMNVDIYYQLLVRAVNLPEGPMRLEDNAIPSFLRPDAEGESARRRRARIAMLEARVRGRLGIRRALSDLRRRRALAAQAATDKPHDDGN